MKEVTFPDFDLFKAVWIGDVVYDAATVCSSVEGAGQGLKPFLPGCVPNLNNTHFVLIELDFLV